MASSIPLHLPFTHFWVVQPWVVLSLLLFCTGRELVGLPGADRFQEMLIGGSGAAG